MIGDFYHTVLPIVVVVVSPLFGFGSSLFRYSRKFFVGVVENDTSPPTHRVGYEPKKAERDTVGFHLDMVVDPEHTFRRRPGNISHRAGRVSSKVKKNKGNKDDKHQYVPTPSRMTKSVFLISTIPPQTMERSIHSQETTNVRGCIDPKRQIIWRGGVERSPIGSTPPQPPGEVIISLSLSNYLSFCLSRRRDPSQSTAFTGRCHEGKKKERLGECSSCSLSEERFDCDRDHGPVLRLHTDAPYVIPFRLHSNRNGA